MATAVNIASFNCKLTLFPSRKTSTSMALEKFRRRAVLHTERLSSSSSSSEEEQSSSSPKSRFEKKSSGPLDMITEGGVVLDDPEIQRLSVKDYLERSKDLIKSDGGPPRWFSPLECGVRCKDAPLLLYLPGIDGTGLGLISQYQRLGKIFDIWCLHIPVMDRTPFKDMVELVEMTVKAENSRSPGRPIYLIGESIGGCLAMAIAARNPDIDLLLILVNPATSFSNSQLQPLAYLLEITPQNLHVGVPSILGLLTGDPLRIAMASVEKGNSPEKIIQQLSENVAVLLPSFPLLADILPGESILWKLQMLRSASSYVNFRLRKIKAEVLILASGRDLLFPSEDEAKRLNDLLPHCQIRNFKGSGHTLLMEDSIDLVTVIKGAHFYRRTRSMDYVSDFMPPTYSEFQKVNELVRLFDKVVSPVMLSTLEDGTIVRGLEGIPCEGPVLFVGYHMLMGLDMFPLMHRTLAEKNIMLRGMAHPFYFAKEAERDLLDPSFGDIFRIMGVVPVSGKNLFKLLARKSHVFLYPGGIREAFHRKGEEYQLFWPSQPEFVRVAARFGAKIVPFGVIGEDDLFDVFLDYNDQVKLPFIKDFVEMVNDGRFGQLRTEIDDEELAKQVFYIPGVIPKLPGRFYYLFGKPIETEGRKQELRDKEKARELYLHVKSEVERYIAYLKEKRQQDPYRTILSRIPYQATHGLTSEVPTFDI